MTEGSSANLSTSYKYVVDGGWLLHKLPWTTGATFGQICLAYASYVKAHFGNATVVFDGYEDSPSTRDQTHLKRSKGIRSPDIDFSGTTTVTLKKDFFLNNQKNKGKFILLLAGVLSLSGCRVGYSSGDAHFTIATAAVTSCFDVETCLVGNDTDVLVLLLHHCQPGSYPLFLRAETKPGTAKLYNI